MKLGKLCCALASCVILIVGCADDSALLSRIASLEEQDKSLQSQLDELRTMCSQLNTNISALQTIVNALQDRDYVTNILPITESGQIVGYTIGFKKSGIVSIYNGKDGKDGSDGQDGKDGTDGKDGNVPAIAVRQGQDGVWYWTLDGEWLLDGNGEKVQASAKDGKDGVDGVDGKDGSDGEDGVTPQLKIEDGYWYISYDGGKTWLEDPVGQATGDKGDSIITNVTYNEEYVYITLPDQTVLAVPRNGQGEDIVSWNLEEVAATTATFTGHLKTQSSDLPFSQVIVYYSSEENFNIHTAAFASTVFFDENGDFSIILKNLRLGTKYRYCIVTEIKSDRTYSEVDEFTTEVSNGNIVSSLSMDVSGIDVTTATFNGTLLDLEVLVDLEEGGEIGVSYTEAMNYSKWEEGPGPIIKLPVSIDQIDLNTGSFSIPVSGLTKGTKYYFSAYIKLDGTYYYSAEDEKSFTTLEDNPYETPSDLDLSGAVDLSESESSNCYVITSEDCKDNKVFKFAAVKGNDKGQGLSGAVSSTILWESAGTYQKTDKCSIIKGFCYKDGYVGFELPAAYKAGNAVLAVKDAAGNILWSWHIWLPGEFKEQVYPNDAGIVMDRNLGATSDRGDGDCGLLYQWGRKDPFLGYTGAEQGMAALSSITWPGAVYSTLERGTIEWSIKNPTTFLVCSSNWDESLSKRTGNGDWLYNPASANGSTEAMIGRERWGSEKTIYDPCPAGWKVPNGGVEGLWNTAGFKITRLTRITAAITHPLNGSEIAYYPAAGSIVSAYGTLSNIGTKGSYWTAHTSVVVNPIHTSSALYFVFNFGDWPTGEITEGINGETGNFATYKGRFSPAEGCSVRCCKIQ